MILCKHCNGTGAAPDNKAIGNTLRESRQSAEITLRQMACWLGISHPFLSQLENGTRGWKRSLRKRYEQIVEKHMHKHYTGV